jgi:uncharacterized membrane protein
MDHVDNSIDRATERWESRRIRHAHQHPPVKNVNRLHADGLTAGERIADGFAAMMGSWTFIITQTVVLAVWIAINVIGWLRHWDPYPFILLNLALSFQAAYAAPIIMMSQNRQADKDRLMAEQDYEVNAKAEDEVKAIMHHLEQQDEVMIEILRRVEEQQKLSADVLKRLEDNQKLLLAAHAILDRRENNSTPAA